MAQGDLTIFDEAKLYLLDGTIDLDTDVIKVGFISNAKVPLAADGPLPKWADYTQVSGGNFPATPDTMTVTLTEAAGTVTLDFTTNISYAKNASNPNNVYYAIIYSDTATATVDAVIGFVEIDAAGADGTAGLISLTWGANVFTMA